MILIIGGFAQGKLHYVKQRYARCEDGRKVAVLDGTLELPAETGALQVIVNHLHHSIREQLRLDIFPEIIQRHGIEHTIRQIDLGCTLLTEILPLHR